MFIFLYKNGNLKKKLRRNLIKIHHKTHQIESLKKQISGEHAPESPLAMDNNIFSTCKFANLKKNSCPPLPNPGDAPV